jgi:hypothetical protein
MSEWQSVIVANDEKDWLRVIASTGDDEHKKVIGREISDSCDFAEIPDLEMPEDNGD